MPLTKLTRTIISKRLFERFTFKRKFQNLRFGQNSSKWKVGITLLAGGNILYYASSQNINAEQSDTSNNTVADVPHIVVVGGGIMGSWSTYLLSQLINEESDSPVCKVTLVDAGHPIRGSWGDTRALHVAMEDDVRIKMNMLNVNEYLKLQRESTSDLVLVKKVGRVFVGPEDSMQKMHDLIKANGIPVQFVDDKFMENPANKSAVESFQGIQIRSKENGYEGWKTLFTPVGFIMKANAILNHLREKTKKLAEKNEQSIAVFEDHKVVSIDQEKRTLTVKSNFDDEDPGTQLQYDKLLITAGPWTNQILGPSTMHPALPQLPVVISNEQTQDFALKESAYSSMPLVTYSDGGYVRSGGDYWFIVGPCPDVISEESREKHMKVGFHRQGELMDNEEFQLPKYDDCTLTSDDILKKKLINKLPHLRKDIKRGKDAQSFEVDEFILEKAKTMVKDRFPDIDVDNVEIIMRCLYQNTPDKEFIVGYPNDEKNDIGKERDIVVACGFNGGGFQMAPMIARLCIKLLLSELVPTGRLVKSLEIGDEQANDDYKTEGKIRLSELLETMQKKFDPSRPSLKT
eukprot:GFUD01036010.1.p1 GENE.GFUD01036010.1~~GFUD01036010.1.p1  ORF type:complete len:574 (+),score=141.78 GFUD01036010.1:180-1901(+)